MWSNVEQSSEKGPSESNVEKTVEKAADGSTVTTTKKVSTSSAVVSRTVRRVSVNLNPVNAIVNLDDEGNKKSAGGEKVLAFRPPENAHSLASVTKQVLQGDGVQKLKGVVGKKVIINYETAEEKPKKKKKKKKKIKPGTKARGTKPMPIDTSSKPCWVPPTSSTSSGTMTIDRLYVAAATMAVPSRMSRETNTPLKESNHVGVGVTPETVSRDTMTDHKAKTINKGIGTAPYVEPKPIMINLSPVPAPVLKPQQPIIPKKKYSNKETMTKRDVKSQMSMTEVKQRQDKSVSAAPDTADVALSAWKPDHFTKAISAVVDIKVISLSTSDLLDFVHVGCGTETKSESRMTMTNILTKRNAFTMPKNNDMKYVEKLKKEFEDLRRQHELIKELTDQLLEESKVNMSPKIIYNTKHCRKGLRDTERKLKEAVRKLQFYEAAPSPSTESLNSQCSCCNSNMPNSKSTRCSCSTLPETTTPDTKCSWTTISDPSSVYNICTCVLCDDCVKRVGNRMLKDQPHRPACPHDDHEHPKRRRHKSTFRATKPTEDKRKRVHSVYIEGKEPRRGRNVSCLTPSGTHSIYMNYNPVT